MTYLYKETLKNTLRDRLCQFIFFPFPEILFSSTVSVNIPHHQWGHLQRHGGVS